MTDKEFSSYKDPDAQVCYKNNEPVRKVFYSYKANYDMLMASGLYDELTVQKLIIPHKEIFNSDDEVYKLIQPEKVFISYPWEWSFSQLKDAALTTLKIQKIALKYNMSLKDANFFNIQFFNGKPVLIDTTSFEIYPKDKPWMGYKQYCTNFLCPLLLMKYHDVRLSNLLLKYIEGIPLDLTSKMLPKYTYLNPKILSHIHLHSKFQAKLGAECKKAEPPKIKKEILEAVIQDLISFVESIEANNGSTEWQDYYSDTNYSDEGFESKKEIINNYKNIVKPNFVVDFGANTGIFSKIFSKYGIKTVALDIDENAVEKSYCDVKKENDINLIPLICDISNPAPTLGFASKERKSLIERLKGADLSLALALIHHLRITYNIPLIKTAEFFKSISKHLIIEFIPKTDSKVMGMLANRQDIFPDYTQENFENEFGKYYNIVSSNKITNSDRILYLMETKNT